MNCSICTELTVETSINLFHDKQVGLISVDHLDEMDVKLIAYRTGLEEDKIQTICDHHKQTLLTKYEWLEKNCCNPFKNHKKQIKGSLKAISLKLADKAKAKLLLIPGKKLCPNCRIRINKLLDDEKQRRVSDEEMQELDASTSMETEKTNINECFSAIGISPMKTKGLHDSGKARLGKRKLSSAIQSIKTKVSRSLNIDSELLCDEPLQLKNEILDKAKCFDEMIEALAAKVKTVESTKMKIQILTLAPTDWSHKKVMNVFGVSEHIVRNARKLCLESGILAVPEQKRGKSLPVDIAQLVQAFYQDDEYTRLMPGRKDYVSIKRNVHQQKRLILCNLNELFRTFKEQNPTVSLGFSKFCSLRPKWCVLAGSAGTHAVCVCTIHQNLKLLLEPLNVLYQDLLKYIVCNTSNRQCMIHRCINCPKSSQELEKFLYDTLEECIGNENSIEFSQWTTSDRSTLITHKESCEAYVDLVIVQLNKLAPHSYLAKSQSRYLKQKKEDISDSEVLFLGDFAENYKFVVQDEIQSFHWSTSQCTLHPVVLYFKLENTMQSQCFCIISSDNSHDVAFVYMVQKNIIEVIKSNLPNVKSIEYFTDGCAAQYKNYKNFANLCNHQKDFGLDAKWNFFATSHGKQPCDGIGGTVKRIVAKESLRRPTSKQILSTEAMFEYCKSTIEGIKFILIKKEEVEEARRSLAIRFENASTVPGTRSFHQFIPLNRDKIAMKQCSEDEHYELIYDFSIGVEEKPMKFSVSEYVCCRYDSNIWIGMVLEINMENKDLLIKFMHPALPSHSFYWKEDFKDICFVPFTNILCTIDVPTTPNGRVYHLSKVDKLSVQKIVY